MCSASRDVTARATIREVALALFSESGPDAVSLRQIAGTAGVSAALVLHHFGSKQGLRDAVDEHVMDLIDGFAAEIDDRDVVAVANGTDEEQLTSMADRAVELLPPGSPVPAYITRLLLSGDEAGHRLFRSWYDSAVQGIQRWEEKGLAVGGPDPGVRAAVLLAHDLSSILLRRHIVAACGVDVLTAEGMASWNREVAALYGGRLWPVAAADHTTTPMGER